MINLLPPDLKQDYLYARRNSILRRWILACVAGLMGVAVVTIAGMLYIEQSVNSYRDTVAKTETYLREQKLSDVQKQSADITSSLKLVVQVLSREVLFSQLLKQIATVTPSSAVMTDLSISKTEGAIDITAITADYSTATQLQVNLEDPANKIFSKADILNISCSASASDQKYPCQVSIRALFADNNPFLFINTKGIKK